MMRKMSLGILRVASQVYGFAGRNVDQLGCHILTMNLTLGRWTGVPRRDIDGVTTYGQSRDYNERWFIHGIRM